MLLNDDFFEKCSNEFTFQKKKDKVIMYIIEEKNYFNFNHFI